MTVKNSMTVLIAEDDVQVRSLLREMIEELHEHIIECCDGAEAVQFCSEETPDVVLMDIRMPRMNGIEATRRIVALHKGIRVLIVTQYEDDVYRLLAREAGAEEFFLKEDLFSLQDYLRAHRERTYLN